MLSLSPITLAEANEFVRRHHRHRGEVVGHRYSIACSREVDGEQQICGVVIVGRPVARNFDDGLTLEITRCCTDGTRNACSFLYGAAWRAGRALGYQRIITYTLTTESGSGLRAAGWKVIHEVYARGWNCETRPRVDLYPHQEKLCWSATRE